MIVFRLVNNGSWCPLISQQLASSQVKFNTLKNAFIGDLTPDLLQDLDKIITST